MSILCATDFSEPAQAAADVAALLAKKLQRPLHLVHCAHEFIAMGDLQVLAVPDDRVLLDQLAAEATRLRAKGVEVTEELRYGGAGWDLVLAATERPVTLIVVGSVGRSEGKRWLVGSVAESVAESAPVPTLVVRQAAPLLAWLGGRGALDLLCGVDLAGSADMAISWTRQLATVGPLAVGAAYVQPLESDHFSTDESKARQRDVFGKVEAELGDLPLALHMREAFKQPAEEFLQLAEVIQPALLVIGTHQHHGLQRLKASSFSRRVLAHATTNVLCVPATKTTHLEVPAIRRVLLATDHGELTVDSLRHAHSLLPAGGEIRMVHVCEEPTSGVNPVISSEVYFDHSLTTAKMRAEAEEKFKELPPALLHVPGVKITTEVLTHHDPASAICAAAELFGADVICMGTKGHSRMGVALLGSTVQAVLARSSRPVFIVTPPHT